MTTADIRTLFMNDLVQFC